jgi:hypothetical protein
VKAQELPPKSIEIDCHSMRKRYSIFFRMTSWRAIEVIQSEKIISGGNADKQVEKEFALKIQVLERKL